MEMLNLFHLAFCTDCSSCSFACKDYLLYLAYNAAGDSRSQVTAVWAVEMSMSRNFFAQTLGGGFKYFLFSPLPGEMIQFDYSNITFRQVETTN